MQRVYRITCYCDFFFKTRHKCKYIRVHLCIYMCVCVYTYVCILLNRYVSSFACCTIIGVSPSTFDDHWTKLILYIVVIALLPPSLPVSRNIFATHISRECQWTRQFEQLLCGQQNWLFAWINILPYICMYIQMHLFSEFTRIANVHKLAWQTFCFLMFFVWQI